MKCQAAYSDREGHLIQLRSAEFGALLTIRFRDRRYENGIQRKSQSRNAAQSRLGHERSCQPQRSRTQSLHPPRSTLDQEGMAGCLVAAGDYLYRSHDPDMLVKMGVIDQNITVGAVCVYPSRVRDAVEALDGADIPVASVATGFPAGQTPLQQRIAEIEQAIEAGAREIDVVIHRTHVLTGNWQALYDEIKEFRHTCGDSAHMKTILATGDLGTLKQIYQASLVAMMAGSDFIKTSTGKESVNATLEFGLVMTRAIREYWEQTGYKVGFKPAGGISKAKQTLVWQALMKEELGVEWLMPDLFRIGASSLLTDLERQLYHFITGHYAARHHMPMG